MTYLSLEISQLLEKLGCTSESNRSYDLQSGAIVPTLMVDDDKPKTAAFIFQDLTIKENAVKIWGDGILRPYIPELENLLTIKLNGEDWQSELLTQLKGKE